MEIRTVCDIFYKTVNKDPEKTMFMYKEGGSYRKISAGTMKDRVEAIANGLISLGLPFDSKVAILSHNCWQWAAADLATISAGAADVTIYPTLLSDQIEYIINDSDSEMIFVENLLQYEKIAKIKDKCSKLKYIIVMDNTFVSEEHVFTFDALMEKGKAYAAEHPDELKKRMESRGEDDLLTLIYTSGTTGNPKGVMLTHKNLVSNITQIDKVLEFKGEMVALSFLPLSHVLERMAGYYSMMYFGAAIAYAESIETVAQNMAEVRPTHMVSVPRLYEKMYAKIIDTAMSGSPLKKKIFLWATAVGKEVAALRIANKEAAGFLAFKYKIAKKLVFDKLKMKTGGRIRFFISGGAPLSKEIAEFFLAADLLIFEGYGLTETSPVISANYFGNMKPGTVGRVMPDYEVKIAEDGEILFKGDNLMTGYYKNEAATAEVMTDGWFHTGDIGMFDEDGLLVITDRKKELIVTSGGKNIAPQPIEGKLKDSKYISQAVLIGDKRKFISALIVPDYEAVKKWCEHKGYAFTTPEDAVKMQEVIDKIQSEVDKVNENVARYEQVKVFALLPAELSQEAGELTPTLKVKRRVVNENYKDIIDNFYA